MLGDREVKDERPGVKSPLENSMESKDEFLLVPTMECDSVDEFIFDDKIYAKTEEIDFRIKTGTDSQNINCEQLLEVSDKKSKTKKARKIKKTYFCKECEYKCNALDRLNTHVETKHRGIFYPCSHCDVKLVSKGSLKQHIEAKHSDSEFNCNACAYKTKSRIYLKLHMTESSLLGSNPMQSV